MMTRTTGLVAASVLVLACQPRAANQAEDPAVTARAKPAAAPAKAAETSEGEQRAEAIRASLVGRRAPAVTLPLLDGGSVALAELIGRKPIYLKFWATWCKPCRKQMPHLEAAHHKYGDRIAIYAVDLGVNDPIETVRAFRTEYALTVPIAIDADGALAEHFEVAVTPMHVLIDRAGVVRYVGHEASPALDAALEGLLGEASAPGEPAPRAEPTGDPLSLTLRDGSRFTLAAHAGQPVALTFVLAWCDTYLEKTRPAMSEACIAHERQVTALRHSHPGITWVIVAHPVWTSPAELDDYLKTFGGDASIGIDRGGGWFRHFAVRDTPTTILFDGRGQEVTRVAGRGDALADALGRLR
jgi:peroxiredoxin